MTIRIALLACLISVAAAETRAATEAFCTWLANEGFWYD